MTYPTHNMWYAHDAQDFTECDDFVTFSHGTYWAINIDDQERTALPIGPVTPPLHGPQPMCRWYHNGKLVEYLNFAM